MTEEQKKAVEPPKEDDPSEGVITHPEGPFVEVRMNTVWAASYVDGEIASAIRLFHRPEFIVDLMVNSTHEAVKNAGKKWQGTEATDARKFVEKAVKDKQLEATEKRSASKKPKKGGKK